MIKTVFIWIVMGVTAATVSAIALGLHKWDVARIEARHKNELAAQALDLSNQCALAKAITKGLENDLQGNLGDLDRRYDDALRLLFNPGENSLGGDPLAARRDDATAARPELPRLGSRSGGTCDRYEVVALGKAAEREKQKLLTCQKYADACYRATQGTTKKK